MLTASLRPSRKSPFPLQAMRRRIHLQVKYSATSAIVNCHASGIPEGDLITFGLNVHLIPAKSSLKLEILECKLQFGWLVDI